MLRKVFKWLTDEGGDAKAPIYVNWFTGMFAPKEFQGVDRLLVCFIKYCSVLSITPKRKYLDVYLKIDGKRDVKKFNIKAESMNAYDYNETSQLEEAFRIIADLARSTYDEYITENLIDREFKVDVSEFMSDKSEECISSAMIEAFPKLSDGSDKREVSANLRDRLAEIDRLYDITKISNVDIVSGVSGSNVGNRVFMCKTLLPCVDGDIGGVYGGVLYTLTSQPKAGKTRLGMIHWVYQVMTVAKKDVILYKLEMQPIEYMNILIAYHITRVYGGRIKISDSVMLKYEEMSPEQKQIYESARIDLFESGRYGKLIIREKLYIETFMDEASAIIKASGNTGLLMVDYVGLSEQDMTDKYARRLDEYKIITETYKILSDIKRAFGIAILAINQFNDKGIDFAYAGKPIRSGMVQGGHIITRHTDYDMYLTYTEELWLAQCRKFEANMVRGAAGFRDVLLSTDLSVSIFRQQSNV